MANKPNADDLHGEKPVSGTDKPWEKPGQAAQSPNQNPTKPDLERWQDSNTH